jgi:serine/threonine protein kinase
MNHSSDHTDAVLHGLPVSSDPENFRAREPLEVLISRFADAVRRGEQPSIEEYARRYSEWADQIRELFPLIQTLEHWKTDKEMECLRRSVPQEFPIRQLGPYRLICELGRGGMGIVFEAEDESSGQHRAIKLLPWRYATGMAQWEEQFQREAKTIAGLQHANIVRVYAFGTHEGYCYYVMDLIAGVSLDWIIRRLREANDLDFGEEIHRAGRDDLADAAFPAAARTAAGLACRSNRGLRQDSWREFANIALSVALALAHAHEAGVLHNDIKPANLLLDGEGNVIVTDFGIGRRTALEAEHANDSEDVRRAVSTDTTNCGGQSPPGIFSDNASPPSPEQQVGTLRYMAPERLLGHCDVRTDVYSLGVTLYELATQTPAFAAEDRRALMELIVKAQFVPPRQVVPLIPRPLETIILNAMLADPQDRYHSAAALASDLLRFINNEPVADHRPGIVRRTARWLAGHR